MTKAAEQVVASRLHLTTKKFVWSLLFLFVGSFGAAQTVSQTTSQTPDFPLSALEPGQRGYALTATSPDDIARFDVEVLALQYDAGTGFPLVLVRTSGPVIDASGGIASGMSGSPVYLPHEGENALLGAVSFAFPESTGGLGLVTPIETTRQADPRAGAVAGSAPQVARFGPQIDLTKAVPVRTPLLLSGLSTRASTFLAPLLDDRLEPLTLGTTGASSVQTNTYAAQDRAFVLEPGSAVSAQLVRGDVTVAAVGTLTLVEDGAFWAFGHPLLGQGAASFALAPAYVTAVVPSRNVPFKLADSGRRVLGSVTQDRPYAISGVLGRAPRMVPVTLSFHGEAGNLRKRFDVTADERLYAPLLSAATLQAFDELLAARGGGTADLAWTITLRGGRTVRVLEQAASPDDVAFAAAGLAAEPLGLLAANPFRPAEVERIDVTVDVRRTQRVAELVEVVPERRTLRAGGTAFVNVRLQPYRDEPTVERVRIPLPPRLRGPVTLSVRGGATAPEGDEGGNGEPLLSFAELLAALETDVQSSELVVEATVDGEPRLLTRLSLPYLVSGSETVDLTVRGNRPPRRDAPEPAPETPEPDADANPDPETEPELEPEEPRDPPLEEPPLEPNTPARPNFRPSGSKR